MTSIPSSERVKKKKLKPKMNSAAVQSCAEVIKMFEKSSEEKKKFCISKYLQKKKSLQTMLLNPRLPAFDRLTWLLFLILLALPGCGLPCATGTKPSWLRLPKETLEAAVVCGRSGEGKNCDACVCLPMCLPAVFCIRWWEYPWISRRAGAI